MDKSISTLASSTQIVSTLEMYVLSDFHAERLIIRHCMATEGTADAEYALQVARLKNFIIDGTPTRAGRIVATLMQANEEVDDFKIKQISERLGKEEQQINI